MSVTDKGTCDGDSGGPLVQTENIEKNTLIRLNSFGPEDCRVENFPTGFTRVSKFLDWIAKRMIGPQPAICHDSRSSKT